MFQYTFGIIKKTAKDDCSKNSMKIDNHPEWTAMRSACCNDVDFCNDKNNLTLANIQSG